MRATEQLEAGTCTNTLIKHLIMRPKVNSLAVLCLLISGLLKLFRTESKFDVPHSLV